MGLTITKQDSSVFCLIRGILLTCKFCAILKTSIDSTVEETKIKGKPYQHVMQAFYVKVDGRVFLLHL